MTRDLALSLALLFPLALMLGEGVLRFTHHRPLGAVTLAAGIVVAAFAVRALVFGVSEAHQDASRGDSSSQIETEDAPVASGVMSRRGAPGREPRWIGALVILWALALSWVFFG